MITETLFGFACLIANGDAKNDPTVAKAIEIVKTLKPTEQRDVVETIKSGFCFPEQFEKLILQTRARIERGEVPELRADTRPSHACG